MMRRRSALTLVFVCGLAAACGDDDAVDSPANQATPDAAVADAAPAHVDGDAHSHGGSDAAAAPDATVAAFDKSCTTSIRLLDFELDPSAPSVSAGPVVFCARNDGRAPHDLGVRGADMQTIGKTATLGPGESAMFTLTLTDGSYAIYCSQAGHESLGMKGTLTVR